MNDEQLNNISAAIVKLDTKLGSGFGQLEIAKADKSDSARVLQTLDYLVEHHSPDEVERVAQSAQLSRHAESYRRLRRAPHKAQTPGYIASQLGSLPSHCFLQGHHFHANPAKSPPYKSWN